jgi:hypothetical protein
MLPEHLFDKRRYRDVHWFVKNQLSMQYGDVRSMPRLPLLDLGITSGCNFAAATCLCNLVSGISVSLYKPQSLNGLPTDRGTSRIATGKLFTMLLVDFYPWEQADRPKAKAEAMYDYVRNGLVHALAQEKESDYHIAILKGKREKTPWTIDELDSLERSETRPDCLSPAITGAGKRWSVSVEGFYWGMFQLLRKLARDGNQMKEAEKRLRNGKVIWNR